MRLTESRCMRITSRNGCSFTRIAGERPDRFGDARAGQVRLAAHDGRDGAGVVAALIAVVGNAHRHQQRAEVGEAEAQRPEIVRVLARSSRSDSWRCRR